MDVAPLRSFFVVRIGDPCSEMDFSAFHLRPVVYVDDVPLFLDGCRLSEGVYGIREVLLDQVGVSTL